MIAPSRIVGPMIVCPLCCRAPSRASKSLRSITKLAAMSIELYAHLPTSSGKDEKSLEAVSRPRGPFPSAALGCPEGGGLSRSCPHTRAIRAQPGTRFGKSLIHVPYTSANQRSATLLSDAGCLRSEEHTSELQ